jgi:NAD(P)H-flavin reductase
MMPAPPISNPWLPRWCRITASKQEAPGVFTYELAGGEATSPAIGFLPGQFNMLYVPGCGEAAISISSDPGRTATISHTVRVVGNVTRALARLHLSDQVGVRGPFGSAWPIDTCRGCDLVIACGGVGLAPLRPVIYHILRHRGHYGRVHLLYGARTPQDLLYSSQYDVWRGAGVEVNVTVDLGDEHWQGRIGVVPMLMDRLRLQATKTRIFTCGPEVMMRFVIREALGRQVHRDHIFMSMERNMNCALGFCGHCQLGPAFVCKDGPVFTYEQLEPYLHVEDF